MAISGTHTHSGPAGFLQYVLYQVTSLGYVQETLDAWVNGISSAVIAAHKDLQTSRIMVNQGMLYGSNINRSPTSYLLNPEDERAQYPEGDTDKTMLLMEFLNPLTKKPRGVLNFFAVHGTAMNNTNTLVSGDNRGYASYSLERDINGIEVPTGKGQFVAAFASTNLGDVSPNTAGPRCIDTGLPCDGSKSTCNGRCEKCIAFGPGTNGDMFESTQIIGNKQYEFAKQLMETATEEIVGPIDYRHSFVDMSALNVTLSNGDSTKLCDPAMGYSFAAGTTDGPGMFSFTQGTITGNPFWDKVADFLSTPTEEQVKCQAPKPILINTGGINFPHEWDPRIVPVQILRIGNFFIIAAPNELTTMAGRRLRNAVRKILEEGKLVKPGQQIYIAISGLTNTYSSYTTTYEEYQAQRYEAASTIFGPHTLDGYIQEFSRLAKDLVSGQPSVAGPNPPDLSDKLIQLMPEPKFDRVADDKNFGDVVEGKDAQSTYKSGDLVSVQFHAANPRNNQRVEGSYLTVEYTTPDAKVWKTFLNDADWATKFFWLAGKEDPLDLGLTKLSVATLSWKIDPKDIPEAATAAGTTFRICYHGDHKVAKLAKVIPFSGCSSTFSISDISK